MTAKQVSGGAKPPLAETPLLAEAEDRRIEALLALDVLDTPPEAEFDFITDLAAKLFGVPVALLSLVDRDRQWFKSRHGTALCETGRDVAFCSRAIENDELLEVVNLSADPRFADNPLVAGPPFIRYYAGSPLKLRSGHIVGTLCLLDLAERPPLEPDQRVLLAYLARLAVIQLELRQLRRSGAIAEAVARATPDAIVCADNEGKIVFWNGAAETMFGYAACEALGNSVELIIPDEHKAAHGAGMARVAGGGTPRLAGRLIELPAVRRDGSRLDIELSLAAWTGEDGLPAGFGATIRDLTARKALQREKADTQRFLDTVIASLPAMLFVKDAQDGRYLLWNAAAEAATACPAADVLGHTDAELFPDVGKAYALRDAEALAAAGPKDFESRFVRGDGSERILRTRRVGVPDEQGRPRYLLGVTEDVTDWRAAQGRLAFLAGHDPLTNLFNRQSFGEAAESALATTGEGALLAINLDGFRSFNDTYGNQKGDMLLVRIGQIMKAAGQRGDIAARTNGDEFAMMLVGAGAGRRARSTAAAIMNALGQPLDVGTLRVPVSLSIGVAVAPADGDDLAGLARHADLALARAKSAGRGQLRFFEEAMDRSMRERRLIEASLREAIAEGSIGLHFQPLAALETGKIIGFEALARWRHAELDWVPPDLFIAIAEESGLIVPLGAAVLRLAAAEAARWDPALQVAVNLSPAQVQAPGFFEEVSRILDETGLAPDRLELEVTEGLLLSDADPALAVLRRLKRLGVRFAMDDFGTGYSSLSYFRMFAFDKIKIDQSFVRDMERSPQALAIVQAVIGLARGLGLPVVAEGVERAAQFELLRAEGCAQVQGYLIGKPAPIECFEGIIARRSPAARRSAA